MTACSTTLRLPFDKLLCGCQVANAQMLLCFFFLLNHPRPKRDLLLCVARHAAVTLTRNAPLSKAPSPGISVSRSNRQESLSPGSACRRVVPWGDVSSWVKGAE
jgi:hypothetical protein